MSYQTYQTGEGWYTAGILTGTLRRGKKLTFHTRDGNTVEIDWCFVRQYAASFPFVRGFEEIAAGSASAQPDEPTIFVEDGPSVVLGVVGYSVNREQLDWIRDCQTAPPHSLLCCPCDVN